MSNLQTIQQQLLQAVLAERAVGPQALEDDARASTLDRLAIYRHGYRVRLRDALAMEFPGLALMAGKRIDALLSHYIDAHPSGHYNIRWHGAGLAAYLDYALPWRNKPELAAMATLDWAISTVFDAIDEPALAITDLANLPSEAWAALRLQPLRHLQIISTSFNVDAFRRAADQQAARPRLRRYNKERHLLVWRQAQEVRYRAIDNDERAVLNLAIEGVPFAQLCECVAQQHDRLNAMPRMATLLQQWLASGLISRFALS